MAGKNLPHFFFGKILSVRTGDFFSGKYSPSKKESELSARIVETAEEKRPYLAASVSVVLSGLVSIIVVAQTRTREEGLNIVHML